ncbi:MAG: hypothetical protein K9M44_02660 [Candidatus Pacebacteria bacterium]|nr:hypothetical protein [Candidatus Paceibacterota bacterium]
MNYHAIFIHFPIALLVIYSLLEIFSFKIVSKYRDWFYIKFSFLFIGVVSAFPALSTGEILEDLPKYDHKLVEVHSSFASATTNFYLVIAIFYILSIFSREIKIKNFILENKNLSKSVKKIFLNLSNFFYLIIKKRILIITSIIGLSLITIVGGLGGVLASGIDVDPVARFIYYLFF